MDRSQAAPDKPHEYGTWRAMHNTVLVASLAVPTRRVADAQVDTPTAVERLEHHAAFVLTDGGSDALAAMGGGPPDNDPETTVRPQGVLLSVDGKISCPREELLPPVDSSSTVDKEDPCLNARST